MPYNYENELNREIDRKTQGPYEGVVTFISCLENLFNRLSRKSDKIDRVNKIRKNLHPHFISRLALVEPITIDELTKYCKARTWSESYVPFSRNPTNLL